MRVSTTQFQATMNTALQNTSATVQALTEKMASGRRLSLPSDEPITSVRVSRLTREEAALSQYRDNIGALKVRLQQNETSLDSMTKDLLQARDLLVWASDGSNTPQDVNAMAGTLQSLRDSLFFSSNTKDQEGHYLFSGTLTNMATVTYDGASPVGSRYTFTGNTVSQHVVVANGVTQDSNVTVEAMAPLLNWLDSAAALLKTPDVNLNDPAVRTQLATTLNGIDATLDFVSEKTADLGGTQNILQVLDDNHANVSLSNNQALIDLSQLDYGDAAVKLNGYLTALQATQKSYAKVSGLSLFNLL